MTLIVLIVSIIFAIYLGLNPYRGFKVVTLIIFIKVIFLMAGISPTNYKILVELTILSMVFVMFYQLKGRRIKVKTPGIWIVILFAFFVVLSVSLVPVDNVFNAFSFFRHVLFAYLVFLFAYNYPFSKIQVQNYLKFLETLFLLQIFGAVVKVFTVGFIEEYVGFMESSSGSLNAIFPLIGISYFACKHYFFKKQKYLFLKLIGVMFIGIVGIKRGFVAFLPALILAIVYYYYKFVLNKKVPIINFILISPILGTVVVGAILFGISISPYLNKEQKIGGSVDLNYAYEISMYKSFGNSKSTLAKGRIGSTLEILDYRTQNLSLKDWVGDGVGMFVGKTTATSGIRKYNVAVLTILPAFARHILSIGFIGSTLIILFYFYFFIGRVKDIQARNSKFINFIGVFVVVTGLIFIYDYFLYSPVFYNVFVPNFLLFTFAGLLRNQYVKDFNFTIESKE